MNLTPKAQTIERDFQNARAKANYSAFPEFARRYVKHNKDGVGKPFNWPIYLIQGHNLGLFFQGQEEEPTNNDPKGKTNKPGGLEGNLWCSSIGMFVALE